VGLNLSGFSAVDDTITSTDLKKLTYSNLSFVFLTTGSAGDVRLYCWVSRS